jgi:hypothetical protein
MTLHNDIASALRAFAGGASSEDDVIATLTAEGVSPIIAEKLSILLPLAFGRVLLSHLKPPPEFSMNALLLSRDGTWRPYDLAGDEIFKVAVEAATAMYHEGPRTLFEPTATFSAEVDAVNKALEAGADLQGVQLSQTMILRPSFEDWTGLPSPPL